MTLRAVAASLSRGVLDTATERRDYSGKAIYQMKDFFSNVR
jgi:hypothetical protein